ncbi:hypothetical protein [Duganella sp. BuS-21]|uniref:hypothetical protein n=1 Tax=Duganella sp. BuS-21 TaxID=2943848 RepID=UPI0035A5DAEA
MKSFRSALLLMVCLAFASKVPAEARPASHSGTSSSFKSGFSSQKNNSTAHRQPSAPPANRQSGPGAFGKQAGSPASAQPSRNTSAMSRDVDRSAAHDRALQTYDQRRAADNARPLPPRNDTLRQPQQAQRPSPGYQAPPYPAPAPVYQQPSSGNGMMAGVIGFMLGRAMSQSHQPVIYPTTSGNQPAPATAPADTGAATGAAAAGSPDGTGMVGGMPGLGTPAPVAAPAAPTPPEPSFMASVLRLFAWLSVLSLLGWAAVYSVRKFRRLRAGPNYSFERN